MVPQVRTLVATREVIAERIIYFDIWRLIAVNISSMLVLIKQIAVLYFHRKLFGKKSETLRPQKQDQNCIKVGSFM